MAKLQFHAVLGLVSGSKDIRPAFLPRQTVSEQTHLSAAACSTRGQWGRSRFQANDDKLIWRPCVCVKAAYCRGLEMGPSPASHSTAGDPGPRSHTTSVHALESRSHAVDAAPRLRSEPWGRVSSRTMCSLCVCVSWVKMWAGVQRAPTLTHVPDVEIFGRMWTQLHHGDARFFHRYVDLHLYSSVEVHNWLTVFPKLQSN